MRTKVEATGGNLAHGLSEEAEGQFQCDAPKASKTVFRHAAEFFVNPRSCFGFRYEMTNVTLHSVGVCNLHMPAESSFSWTGSNFVF